AVAHAVDVERKEPGAEMRRRRGADLLGADVVELGVDAQVAHRPAVGREPAVQHADDGQQHERNGDAPGDRFEDQTAVHCARSASGGRGARDEGREEPVAGSIDVSRIRQHSSSNEMPTTRAAFGTSEWLVMPGVVLTSSRKKPPLRSRIRSTRPQPEQPAALNASRASCCTCASPAASRPGQMYCVSSATYLAW